MFRRCSSNC